MVVGGGGKQDMGLEVAGGALIVKSNIEEDNRPGEI